MSATPQPAPVTVALLTEADEPEMLAFETANREFFARTVGDRGDEYFASFPARHRRLVAENHAGTSMLFVVRDAEGRVVGRVNIADVDDGCGDVGYRMAEDVCGRGVARSAVRLVLEEAARRGLTRLTAMTTVDNAASQRVLQVTGFERLPDGEPTVLELGGRELAAVHYARTLP